MIVGIGTDIVSVARFREMVRRYGDRVAGRILSQAEIAEYGEAVHQAAFLAKHFAAKEAASKALGTGFGSGVSKKDISVDHDELGKPLLCFTGTAKSICERRGATRAWLSVSDEKEYAIAFVLLESG